MNGHSPQEPVAYRLFTALSVPGDVRAALERAQQELRAALSGDSVRWVRRDQFHVTLTFLGDVSPTRLDALTDALRQACRSCAAPHVHAEGVGVRPDDRRPRLLWVHVREAGDRLSRLHRAVEAAGDGFTNEQPERVFRGHITLGRCRTVRCDHRDVLATLEQAMGQRPFGEWTADSVDLVRSELGPGGSRYTTLARMPLASGPDADVPPGAA